MTWFASRQISQSVTLMEFNAPNIIILILSISFAIFIGRLVHRFFYPDRNGLYDSYKAGVRLESKFGNYHGRSEDEFESMKGGGFLAIVLIAFFCSFIGLNYVLIKATEYFS